MTIREAQKEDFERIWPIFNEVALSGETYAYETNTTKQQAEKIWMRL
ncbi:hypothetical protein TDB9533_00879 [Thalassocella blandensis]|nr:hypothetical protein TDB9533_00879 [Thalassocella blandensis]